MSILATIKGLLELPCWGIILIYPTGFIRLSFKRYHADCILTIAYTLKSEYIHNFSIYLTSSPP